MFSPINRREALRRVGFLVGGALSASTISAVLAGCGGRGADTSAYAFKALDEEQQALTARLVDLIIPETDTPGARAAGAHAFIDEMLAGWMHDDERDRFFAGLADVERRAEAAHGRAFVDLDEAQQVAMLTEMDREAYAPRDPDPVPEAVEEAADADAQSGTDAMERSAEQEVGQVGGSEDGPGGDPQARPAPPPPQPTGPPFFRTLKELTLAGYYTSEIGATQELQWGHLVGRYDADLPLSEVGRTWA